MVPGSAAPDIGFDPAHGYFAALGAYLELGICEVEGWLSPTAAAMLAHLLLRQVRRGVRGDVCEIGVHHGKLFIVLANATVPGEASVAVDVFDQQEKNVDQSGRGDRAMFERNVAAYAPGVALQVIQDSSLDLHRPDFLCRRFRFVSIDGGHTAQATENDLWLAEKTLLDGGLAALDDILSANWTGVLTGLVNYKAAGGRLAPCALVPNKLILATDAASASLWRAELRGAFPLAVAKTGLEFLDAPVESYDESPYYSREARTDLLRERDELRRQREAACEREAAGERATDLLRRDRDRLSLQLDAAALKAATAEREAEILRLASQSMQGEVDALRRDIDALLRSTSWRSTAPLRTLYSMAKRPR